MVEIRTISTGLTLGSDGIWYGLDTQDLSYPPDGNRFCFAIEDNSFWFRHRNNCIISIVKTYPPEDNGAIFDIGGGNGFVSSGLEAAGFDAVLVEPGKVGALNAKTRGLENVICATTDVAKFKPHSLPAVGLFDVIEHLDDDLSFLQSIQGIMKKDGYLYVTVPSYPFLWSEEDVLAGHFRRYSLKSISNVLQAAGFTVVFSSYIFRVIPILVLFLRTLPYKLGLSQGELKAENIFRDHAVNGGTAARIINSLLHSEVKHLKNKRRMRLGGSCLIVARNS